MHIVCVAGKGLITPFPGHLRLSGSGTGFCILYRTGERYTLNRTPHMGRPRSVPHLRSRSIDSTAPHTRDTRHRQADKKLAYRDRDRARAQGGCSSAWWWCWWWLSRTLGARRAKLMHTLWLPISFSRVSWIVVGSKRRLLSASSPALHRRSAQWPRARTRLGRSGGGGCSFRAKARAWKRLRRLRQMRVCQVKHSPELLRQQRGPCWA